MKKLFLLLLAVGALISATSLADTEQIAQRRQTRFVGGLSLGYFGGSGMHFSLMAMDFAQDLPLSFRLGIGYTRVEPGKPDEARRIFINNATNGTPTEAGWMWDYRFDILIRTKAFGLKQANFYVGPRHVRFTGNFNYVGGNEDFDVTSHQWGVGAGLENSFAINPRLGIVVSAGADYFISSWLVGHDTKYNPDGEAINQQEDYTWDDADRAISQPKIEPRVMLGLSYTF